MTLNIKMNRFLSISLFVFVCIVQTLAENEQPRTESIEGIEDAEAFTGVLNSQSRAFRALNEARQFHSQPQPSSPHTHRRQTQGYREQPSSTKGNIVYGKGRVPEPKHQPTRHSYSVTTPVQKSQPPQKYSHKYTPPTEDVYGEPETNIQTSSQYKTAQYDPSQLQKYMQKYANQLYNTQKHVSQLSDAQKFVLSQDQHSKKYVTQQSNHFPAPTPHHSHHSARPQTTKYSSVSHSSAPDHKYAVTQSLKFSEPQHYEQSTRFAEQSQPSLQDYAEPITVDNYHQYQSQQKLAIQQHQSKPTKTQPPKKVYSYGFENAPAGVEFKVENQYGSSDSPIVTQYFSTFDTNSDKATTKYTTKQAAPPTYDRFGQTASASERLETTGRITGYKIPGAVALHMGRIGHPEEKVEGNERAEHHEHHDHHPTAEPKYEFMYQVQDHEKHNHFGHSEARKGKTTWGKYYVQLPDGRFETVKYWADKTGYHAEVEFKGHAKHPSHDHKGHGKADEASSYADIGSAGHEAPVEEY